MTRFRITLQMAAGEMDSFLIESATEGIDFYTIVRQAEERWIPGAGDTVKIEMIEEDAPGPADRRCLECSAVMTPAEGEYEVCRSCRLGPPDPSAEREMTGIRAHLP